MKDKGKINQLETQLANVIDRVTQLEQGIGDFRGIEQRIENGLKRIEDRIAVMSKTQSIQPISINVDSLERAVKRFETLELPAVKLPEEFMERITMAIEAIQNLKIDVKFPDEPIRKLNEVLGKMEAVTIKAFALQPVEKVTTPVQLEKMRGKIIPKTVIAKDKVKKYAVYQEVIDYIEMLHPVPKGSKLVENLQNNVSGWDKLAPSTVRGYAYAHLRHLKSKKSKTKIIASAKITPKTIIANDKQKHSIYQEVVDYISTLDPVPPISELVELLKNNISGWDKLARGTVRLYAHLHLKYLKQRPVPKAKTVEKEREQAPITLTKIGYTGKKPVYQEIADSIINTVKRGPSKKEQIIQNVDKELKHIAQWKKVSVKTKEQYIATALSYLRKNGTVSFIGRKWWVAASETQAKPTAEPAALSKIFDVYIHENTIRGIMDIMKKKKDINTEQIENIIQTTAGPLSDAALDTARRAHVAYLVKHRLINVKGENRFVMTPQVKYAYPTMILPRT